MMRGAAAKNVDEYIKRSPAASRKALQTLRRAIKSACPDAVESISYGMPVYKYNKRPIAYFGAYEKHCSFYPAGKAMVKHFAKELKNYYTSGSTIRFTPDKPLPVALVKKIIKERMLLNTR